MLETLPDISFSENQTRGSCLGCIHEGQSETITKANRGTGTRKPVSSHAKLPGNWKNVLRNDDYKDELFQFLGEERASMDT